MMNRRPTHNSQDLILSPTSLEPNVLNSNQCSMHCFEIICTCMCVCHCVLVTMLETVMIHMWWTWIFEAFLSRSPLLDEVGVGLWEERVMAGFMPLKAELSLRDTFSIPDLSKLSTQVSDVTSSLIFINVGITSNYSSKRISSMKRACMLFFMV